MRSLVGGKRFDVGSIALGFGTTSAMLIAIASTTMSCRALSISELPASPGGITAARPPGSAERHVGGRMLRKDLELYSMLKRSMKSRKTWLVVSAKGIAWVLRLPAVTSALLDASSVAQLEASLDSLDRSDFANEELTTIE
jgi:aryl-alcohol dehydrogenase-like predicted oxidoreductase